MKNTSKTLVFFGSGPVAAKSLGFLSAHFTVEYVVTKAVPTHHKGIAPVEELAHKLGLPVLFASDKNELDELIKNHTFESTIGIVIDYGVVMSQTVINSFKQGIVNSHFSLLPQWRGADPITFAILSGQPKTGVSLMVINDGLDTGKLIGQKSLPIDPKETTPTLTDKLITLSNQMLVDYLPRYRSGEITPKEQPHPIRATYSRKLTKADGVIDLTKSAEQLEREVRAYQGWPKSRTEIAGNSVIITKAHLLNESKTPLDLLCGDGAYLSIDELIAPSGRTMSAAAFINGYAA